MYLKCDWVDPSESDFDPNVARSILDHDHILHIDTYYNSSHDWSMLGKFQYIRQNINLKLRLGVYNVGRGDTAGVDWLWYCWMMLDVRGDSFAFGPFGLELISCLVTVGQLLRLVETRQNRSPA